MAVNNRNEAVVQVELAIVEIVTNTIHRNLLNNNIINSIDFRKDVIASETPSGGSVTVNLSSKDMALVTTATNLVVSFSNIENGDVKYIQITKAAANSISFAGATDVSKSKSYINSMVTVLIYRVSNKDSTILVECINIDKGISDVQRTVVDIGSWNMNSKSAATIPWTSPPGYKIINAVVWIYPDTGYPSESYPLYLNVPTGASIEGGIIGYNILSTGGFRLVRRAGGSFDTTSFQSTSVNRGYLIIDHAIV